MSEFILGLDVSTKTIGIAIYEDKGNYGELKLLHHVTPNIKLKGDKKIEERFLKVNVFRDEFLMKYKDFGITRVIIEEPLLGSNNVHTVGTLLRYNGMISKVCFDILGVVPDFISSYDARAFAFPELMEKRKETKKGEKFTESQMSKKKPVLFGGYPYDVDKKMIMWELLSKVEPQIEWIYDKKGKLKTENFDMSDSAICVLGFMYKTNLWKV